MRSSFVLASVILGLACSMPAMAAQQPLPAQDGTLTCNNGQYLVYGVDQWDLTGSTISQASDFMHNFCLSSIGNSAVNCTHTGGADIGATRQVKQGNGIYITEVLQSLTERSYGSLVDQKAYSVEPNVFNASYTDFSHISTVQVYTNETTGCTQMKMYSNRCVSNKEIGLASIKGLLAKAKTYYVAAIPKGAPTPAAPAKKVRRAL